MVIKGAPALESRTEGRLVSPTTAAEKKIVPLPGFRFKPWFEHFLSIVEHAKVLYIS